MDSGEDRRVTERVLYRRRLSAFVADGDFSLLCLRNEARKAEHFYGVPAVGNTEYKVELRNELAASRDANRQGQFPVSVPGQNSAEFTL